MQEVKFEVLIVRFLPLWDEKHHKLKVALPTFCIREIAGSEMVASMFTKIFVPSNGKDVANQYLSYSWKTDDPYYVFMALINIRKFGNIEMGWSCNISWHYSLISVGKNVALCSDC